MDLQKHISIEYLNRIADHCPRSLSTYLMCYRDCDDDLMLTLHRKSVLNDAYTSWTRTVNNLRELAHEGLLEYHMKGEYIHVNLASHVDD